MPRFGKPTAHARLRKLARKLDPPKPPEFPAFARFVQDGDSVTRLHDKAPATLAPDAPRVIREIVDPEPDDDRDSPLSTVAVVPPEPEPLPDEQPAPPEPVAKTEARESFERRTGHWDEQLSAGLGRQAKKRRGIDRAASEHTEFKKAAKQRRVQLLGKPRR